MSDLEPPSIDMLTTAPSPVSPEHPDDRPDTAVVQAADPTLADSLAAAVLATPGVLRLEPTLQSSLRRFMAATTQHLPIPGGPSGKVAGSNEITITHRPGPTRLAETQVSVDIATSPLAAPALQIARSVRQSIVDCLQLNRHQPGLIHVNVLSIEQTIPQPSST
jgi:hypothetical protein